MREDPTILITCDGPKCEDEIEISLTALSRPGEWDERNVKRELEREGWICNEDGDFCGFCTDEIESIDEMLVE